MNHLLDQVHQLMPPLHIDAIESIDGKESIIAIKNIAISDPIFSSCTSISQANYPTQHIADAHVQTGYLLLLNDQSLVGHSFRLTEIQSFECRHTIRIGNQIRFETVQKKHTPQHVIFSSRGFIDGIQCSAITFAIQPSDAATSGTYIHPTASVHATAMLGNNVHIGPYSIVNEYVSIGENTRISAHVLVEKWTTIGHNNTIEYGAVIGSQPQDMKYKGEASFVQIGNHNHIREYVTINRATGEGASTTIGNNNMLLTNTHIGHNCILGNDITMANVVHVGGHVVIDDCATIGGLTGIHQFVRIGTGTMTGGYSRLIQDIPPFMLCDGNPAYVRNLNIIGCRRRGMSKETLADLKQLYKLLYRSKLTIRQALEAYSPESASKDIDTLTTFLRQDTSRGISKKSTIAPDCE